MPIEKKDLLSEIEKLTEEIKQVSINIKNLEGELVSQRGTLEAKYGALQQCQIFMRRICNVDDVVLKQLSDITGKQIIAAEELTNEKGVINAEKTQPDFIKVINKEVIAEKDKSVVGMTVHEGEKIENVKVNLKVEGGKDVCALKVEKKGDANAEKTQPE